MNFYNPIKRLSCITFAFVILIVPAYAADATPSRNEAGPDPTRLVGRWLRPDGGYVLDLSDPGSDGQLKAAYFNPRPIHVSHAAWKLRKGHLIAYVELRAPNYPGSTYTLIYDPVRDRLVGIYFQAAIRQKFEVEFERIP